MKLIEEKVLRERLLDKATSDTVSFKVGDYMDIESVRTTVSAAGNLVRCRYVVISDSQRMTVTETRKRQQP